MIGRIQRAWCRETSADPDNWREDNPAWGQCAVTALVVQDLLGGHLLRVVNDGVSHYYNEWGLGQRLDLTRQQFVRWEPSIPDFRTREYVLSNEDTARRYELLKRRVGITTSDAEVAR